MVGKSPSTFDAQTSAHEARESPRLRLLSMLLIASLVPLVTIAPGAQAAVSSVTCAIASVEQGVADAINSDCIVLPDEEACMNWSYYFEWYEGYGYGASYGAGFRWSNYLDIIPNVQATIQDVASTQVGVPGAPIGTDGPFDPELKSDEDSGELCFGVVGVRETTAMAHGRYNQLYCNSDGECSSLDKVPHNEFRAYGTVIGTGSIEEIIGGEDVAKEIHFEIL